jgi:Flp pilus assembly protein TadG
MTMNSIMTRKRFSMNGLRGTSRLKRRGASAVEFAVVAPVLFLMIFGMIEFGRLIMVQQIMTNASREGAREAVLDGATSTTVDTHVREYLQGTSIDPNDVAVAFNISPQSATAGDAVTVTLTLDFNDVSWLPGSWFLSNTTMRAQTTMRREALASTP